MCQQCESDSKVSDVREHQIQYKIIGQQLMGIFFGYPSCCIMAFAERSKRIQEALDSKDLQQINEATKVLPIQEGFHEGFIPCVSCASTVRPGEEGKLILATRVCSTPYPIDTHALKEFDDFMKGALE